MLEVSITRLDLVVVQDTHCTILVLFIEMTALKSSSVKWSRVLQPCQLMFNGPPAGRVNQVQIYSTGMKLGAITEDYSREKSSSNE